jgi:hypothetical protein
MVKDAHLNSMIVNALRLSHEFAYLIREGYSQDSLYGDEGEWKKGSHIEAIHGCFWRPNHMCARGTLSAD